MNDKYEVVIGLEVHAQLMTKSKAYSSDSTEFGVSPNTNISVITLGHPGTLPKFNEKALELALKMGLACNSEITYHNGFARKNYFYADLPKGYQITQDKTPICRGGYVEIDMAGATRKINITRIHLEEDAGKSIHDQDPYYTLIDLNRAGVPLIEIVSEPELKTPDEAYEYLSEIRKLVRYLDICDGNMEEGSMRCDANVSVMLKGAKEFGAKVEVKNMNSVRNVKRALEHEIERQIRVKEEGGIINQETRTFNALTGTTAAMRSKEMAHDYRYFPEPDLPPVVLNDEYIAGVRTQMPALPRELYRRYMAEYALSDYDAGVLTEEKEIALYFEEVIRHTQNYKAAANWVMGPVKSYLNENAVHIDNMPVKAEQVAELIALIDDDKLSFTAAAQKLFPELLKKPGAKPVDLAHELNLMQESGADFMTELIERALAKYPDKVEEYRAGKKGLVGLFMGEVMKMSKGKADPKAANELLRQKLENN